jgi:hypothetical protein
MLAVLGGIFVIVGSVIYYLALGLWMGGEWLMQLINRRRAVRVARIEAELDRKQDELRATVLQLASALGMEAHEARKALIRESYLASGRIPPADER